jgi:hypothetical protein
MVVIVRQKEEKILLLVATIGYRPMRPSPRLGEELCASEGDFVPPCVGQCLKLYPGEVLSTAAVGSWEMIRAIWKVYEPSKTLDLEDDFPLENTRHIYN